MKNTAQLSQFSFDKEIVDSIAQIQVLEIEPGTILLRESEYVKEVPLVLEGSIKLRKIDENGKEIVFYHIEAGESCILSITSCLNDKASQAEAVIEKFTRLIVVDAECVRHWMENNSTWRKFVMRLYDNRMTELMTLIDLIAFKSVDQRLVQQLKEKSTDNILEITHQQLANELGTAREVISRLLKQMEKEGLIALERGKIKILRPL